MSLLKFFGLGGPAERSGEGDASKRVREIVQALERLDPDRARHIAAFAYILSRVARADLEISPEETLAIERIIRDLGGLEEAEAILVVQMAKTQSALFGGTDDYLVTRDFFRIASREEKVALLHCLFAVSAADQKISAVEDQEIRQIASEMALDHADFIEARSRYREYLSVLKDPQEPPPPSA